MNSSPFRAAFRAQGIPLFVTNYQDIVHRRVKSFEWYMPAFQNLSERKSLFTRVAGEDDNTTSLLDPPRYRSGGRVDSYNHDHSAVQAIITELRPQGFLEGGCRRPPQR